jgi:triacylglycerol esterase/lipase EstA (alpha/beta hydrolase family)
MTGWLNQDFIFGNEVVTTTPSTHHLDEQGQDLENLIQNSAGNNYILIGHSQGGLISRYAA